MIYTLYPISKILTKVCSTQGLYFNRNTCNVLDKSLAMEKVYGPYRDSKRLECSLDHKEYGPSGVCVKIREFYSDLVATK